MQRAEECESKPVCEKRICGDPPLPVARLTPATGHRVFFCPDPESKSVMSLRRRILVVDGDPAVRHMLLRVLDEENYSVRAARTGSEALELARDENYQLLLLDGDLPKENVTSLCSQFTEAHPAMPIIVMVRANNSASPCANGIGVCLAKPL